MKASLYEFRGYVLSFANAKAVPELFLVPVTGGFQLMFQDNLLTSARGEARVFKTADAVIRFVERYICGHTRMRVRVVCETVFGGLL